MKIIVAGGFGFVGSHVVDDLVDRGHEVLVLDDLSSSWLTDDGDPMFKNAGATRIYQIEPCDTLVHLALRHPVEPERAVYMHSFDDYVVNGVRWVAELLNTRSIKRVVVGSSIDVVRECYDRGTPERSLGLSLRCALVYWHRPPLFETYFVHMTELEGERRLPEAPIRLGAEVRHVQEAATVIAARALTTKHYKDVDLVVA